jgi:molybdenum cofactor synthesis domain-containing protein
LPGYTMDNTHKSAGIVIIGNEILSGKVRDDNSFFLLSELRALGVDVRRVSVIPDEIDIIGDEIVEFSDRYDHVFTTGGVGPTHDDVTMKGIAKGFGVRLIRHPEITKLLHSRYKELVNEALMKMAEVPEGADVVFHNDLRFPVITFKNIFIFPGIPEYLKRKFTLIKDRLGSTPYHLRRIFLKAHESEIAEALNSFVDENTDVTVGSYPVVHNPDYRVVLTLESKSSERLNIALDVLKSRLSDHKIVRVE